jgi:2-keto-4-pentenoate hydratase/2-oxohepta-3-ene-1,7-dioic acid hydratase in catechol pathway
MYRWELYGASLVSLCSLHHRCIQFLPLPSVRELGVDPPRFPCMFPKLPNAVAGYGDDVEIPRLAQDNQADYEGELVIVIGKDAKNVAAKDAYDYIVGYTVANDISAR